jgi:polar amino acid transport system substrate-binding protein
MRKHSLLFILIAALTALLVACGGGDDQPEITTGESGLPDLNGREITIAVENAYLPFNYISLATGEPGGWDYDAWDAICELLNCVPVTWRPPGKG